MGRKLRYLNWNADAEMGDIAQWAEHQTSNMKTLGLSPWWGRDRKFSFPSKSTLVQTCLCPTPVPKFCAHIKDPN